ncbi:hypothetical protein [Mycolicibacterium cosmeticum]|uniref:Uncharacterized protein n=1 Tax=Mycolicibacterium cosmeticum TaxID=258533 RepID=W9AYW1_MYCCO|nr:hypothetical protein [Mycolicibacterium cosmeticum]CDO11014.1 hypothetical protein BN977_05855 [Mycolicibacterium cosmeticum]
MAAQRLHCWQCGTTFYGRADAQYCGNACRQRAYRARVQGDPGDGKVLARQTVARARQVRKQAAETRLRALAARQLAADARITRRRTWSEVPFD